MEEKRAVSIFLGYDVRPNMDAKQIIAAAQAIRDRDNCDVFLYNGDIARWQDRNVIRLCRGRERKRNVLLVLVTDGGDPDAAYRISRCFQDHYETFTCFVTGMCKSAGTLLAIGAQQIIMTEHGELGPIDVQMSKKDELWEYQSGLTVTASLKALHERALAAFEHFFLNTKRKSGGSITLKTATDIAAKLTTGLFASIYSQIDPMHVGEAARATAIAREYGMRLNIIAENLKPEALNELIGSFPTHSFVIDRSEAESMLQRIRKPDELEEALFLALGDLALQSMTQPGQPAIVKCISDNEEEDNDGGQEPETQVNPPAEQSPESGAATAGGGV
jgi:hypothetical protein